MSYSNGNVDLTMSNMRINNIKDVNKDFKKFIADELEQIQFQLQIIAQNFIDYENNKEKKGLMNNIGCNFSIIKIRLEVIIDYLKKIKLNYSLKIK